MMNKLLHPENHSYSIIDIMNYLSNSMEISRAREFEEHLKTCHICRNTASDLTEQHLFDELSDSLIRKHHLSEKEMEDYFNNNLSPEEFKTFEMHIRRCNDCSETYQLYKTFKQGKSILTIEQILEDFSIITKLGEEFLQENYSETNIIDFKEKWHYFFTDIFDWENASYREALEPKAGEFSEIGMGFMPAEMSDLELLPIFFIRIIAAMRECFLRYKGEKITKWQNNLVRQINREKLPNKLFHDFLNYLKGRIILDT